MTDLLSLHPERPIRSEVRRLASLLLREALDALADAEHDLNPAIDRLCDRVTKMRGLLRLIRFDIGERVYGVEEERMKDILRLIDPVHQSGLLIARTELLGNEEADRLEIEVLTARLESRHLEIAFALAQSSTFAETETILRSSLVRADKLPVSTDGFPGLRPGFERVAELGLRRMIDAHEQPTGKRLFAWSRQVGFLQTHITLLAQAWPEVLTPTAEQAGRLVRILRDTRELGRLSEALQSDRSLAPKGARNSLVELIGEKRGNLIREAWDLGGRVYSEPPKHLVARLGRLWMQS